MKSLERTFERDRFDNFLKSYFDHFKFQSITTEQAIDYLKHNLFDKYPEITFHESMRLFSSSSRPHLHALHRRIWSVLPVKLPSTAAKSETGASRLTKGSR